MSVAYLLSLGECMTIVYNDWGASCGQNSKLRLSNFTNLETTTRRAVLGALLVVENDDEMFTNRLESFLSLTILYSPR